MFETKTICKICNIEVPQEGLMNHREEHIVAGDVWSAPCKLVGQPSSGVCTEKEHYDACQVTDMLKNNWMCWRDGILFVLPLTKMEKMGGCLKGCLDQR